MSTPTTTDTSNVSGPAAAARSALGGRRWLEVLIRFNLVVILLGLCVAASLLSENFLTTQNILNLFQQSAVVGIVAVGMTFVILTANIDLSVGSMVAFGGMVVAVLIATAGLPVPLAIAVTLLLGVVLGSAMGSISAFVKVPSFMTTLAGLVGIRGATYLLTDGVPVGGMPSSLTFLGTGRLLGFPVMGLFFIAITIIAGAVLRFTVFGEYVYATGGNVEAARLSGVPTRATTTTVFAISGGLATFAGVLLTARLTIGQPTAGEGLELDAIAAVVLGGTSLFGGRGGVLGTFVAVLLLAVLRNLFNLLGLGSFFQMTATGIILIVAIVLNRLIDNRRAQA